MQTVIGLAARKQSGKTSIANYILNNFHDFTPFKTAKIYSFATQLKMVATDILGIPSTLVYGTNEEKETLTDILWENMPHYPRIVQSSSIKLDNLLNHLVMGVINSETYREECEKVYPPTGPMKVRHILQEIGTGMFRTIDNNIWVKATMNKIKNEKYDLAIIDDARFENEAKAVHAFSPSSRLIRLTRAPFKSDEHPSETGLDKYHDYSLVLDNANMNLEQSCEQLASYLKGVYNV